MGGKNQPVYVLLAFSKGETPHTIEVYGARWNGEKRAENLARAEGFHDTRELFYHPQTGELHMMRGGQLVGTGIFLLQEQVRKEPRHIISVRIEDEK